MLDNDAYQGESRALEIAGNLNLVAQGILAGANSGTIRDHNGNKTGIFEINSDAYDLVEDDKTTQWIKQVNKDIREGKI